MRSMDEGDPPSKRPGLNAAAWHSQDRNAPALAGSRRELWIGMAEMRTPPNVRRAKTVAERFIREEAGLEQHKHRVSARQG